MSSWVSVRDLLAEGHRQMAAGIPDPARPGIRVTERAWKTAYWSFHGLFLAAVVAVGSRALL